MNFESVDHRLLRFLLRIKLHRSAPFRVRVLAEELDVGVQVLPQFGKKRFQLGKWFGQVLDEKQHGKQADVEHSILAERNGSLTSVMPSTASVRIPFAEPKLYFFRSRAFRACPSG